MRSSRPIEAQFILGLLMLVSSSTGAAADRYFGYSERQIEITAAGNDVYPVDLARSCLQLDAMLRRVFAINSTYRTPTYIYVIPEKEMERFTGRSGVVTSYHVSALGNAVIVSTSALPSGRDYYDVYFGYVATLLSSSGQMQGPEWYRVGVPVVFAGVVFSGSHARIGSVLTLRDTLIRAGNLIPMQIFLSSSRQEIEQQRRYFPNLYEAQAWYLARAIYVEGWHRAEFDKYLDLMRSGTAETAAFTRSFGVSYEDLGRDLQGSLRDREIHVYDLDVPQETMPRERGSAIPLSAAELEGRLALLSLRYEHEPDAVTLASEALSTEPGNESALRALALANGKQGAWGAALAAADRLPPQLSSAVAYDDRADVLAASAVMVTVGELRDAADAASLRSRAGGDYRAALALDPGDRRAQQGLAKLGRGP